MKKFQERMQALGAKLKLDSHHTIERFAVAAAVFAVTFVMIITTSGFSAAKKYSNQLGTQAIYTTEFTTSKTAQNGTIEGVYTDANKTKAMLLMKFEDSTQMSKDASQYEMFLTGSTTSMSEKQLESNPYGAVYMFGSSGYMGIYLNDVNGFPSEIMKMTLRANRELVVTDEMTAEDSSEAAGDASFAVFDQWRVYFNPGAAEATHVASLDSEQLDVGDLYYDMVVSKEEAEVRKELDTGINTLRVGLNSIDAKEAELANSSVNGVRVIPPARPAPIAGDVVTGEEARPDTPSTLAFDAKTVIEGGYDFDWRNGNVKQGYLDEVVPDGSNYVTYMSAQARETPTELKENELVWEMSDGTNLEDLDPSGSSDISSVKNIQTTVTELTSAYRTYFDNKRDYQVNLLGKLLGLEVNLLDVKENYSVSTEADQLHKY